MENWAVINRFKYNRDKGVYVWILFSIFLRKEPQAEHKHLELTGQLTKSHSGFKLE